MSAGPEANQPPSAEIPPLQVQTLTRRSTDNDSSTLNSPKSPKLPLPAAPEAWLSPLDRIARQQADDKAAPSQFLAKDSMDGPDSMAEEEEDEEEEEGINLRSMERPPVYQVDDQGPQSPRSPRSPRMPFHNNEYFQTGPSQPATPALFEDDGLSKSVGIEPATSRLDLLTEDEPPARKATTTPRAVSFAPSSLATFNSPSPRKDRSLSWPSEPASLSFRCGGGGLVWQWHPSFGMYLCFVFGILLAVGHHIYYSALEGQPALNQTEMLRYGTFLAYAAKAGFSAAVISAYKQRVWVTVRNRFLSIGALDAMFAAAEDVVSLLNPGFLTGAKGAYALALFAWTTPLVVILTANTLLVEPRQISHNTTCPAVRTLNFSFEETNEWRNPTQIDGLFEIPVSLWNTTKRDDNSDPDWFDYYTGPSSNFQQTTTLGAFLEEVVARKHASVDTCGAGWNCTFTINFTAPGYQCSELASGVDSVPRNLTQESGVAVPPFGTDLLLPRGNFSYYASTLSGEYSGAQLRDVSIGGIPLMSPPYPDHFGALRTEPIIWVGYSVLNHPNQSQPRRNETGWDDAFTPKIFACEHRETTYVANFTYIDNTQIAQVISHDYGPPIINTTFLPGVAANDGTNDNVTAVPEANYVYPNNTGPYRRVAAYHSFGRMLRSFMNGTVTVEGTLIQPIENTQAIQTKLLDQRSNYFPNADLMDRVQSLYDDMILSIFSNPQFVEVVWAARPGEQSGTLVTGGVLDEGMGEDDEEEQLAEELAHYYNNASALRAWQQSYLYNCTRFRTENVYSYHKRDLWIVYGIAAFVTLLCITAGAFAIHENGGVTRNTRFSSVVAATRGPALERIAWRGPLQDRGDVPAEVKRLRLGYGVMNDMNSTALGRPARPDSRPVDASGEGEGEEGGHPSRRGTMYGSGYFGEMRCGFGLKGDVDQRHREGSLFHR